MRLVQLKTGGIRRVALVEEPKLRLIHGFDSVFALAQAAIADGGRLTDLVKEHLTGEHLDYDPIYNGESEWKLLPPVDHPEEPSRCLVSGTGLTHLGSARDRQSMHLAQKEQETDSMKMFRWGVEAGRPVQGSIGIAPEWFYKGNGLIVQASNDPLLVPPYAEDGGEEAEVAIVCLIGADGQPYRIGMVTGNEFSDHLFEKRNYLNLAGSKLRTCSIGPELTIDPSFDTVPGTVTIRRGSHVLWSQPIATGEQEMCHSLRNLEHHHFKFAQHRNPGDVHIHFLGAHSLSFGHGVALQDGDIMEVVFEHFGRPLRNPVKTMKDANTSIEVRPLI
ncbi:AraD1 family protein [Paracidobacterium acidisoli]|uniref:GguC protein n=1 Tax=Paracidobacterium acidisoli TaxID=2303751 RepID=A0A372IQJ2_9BACT|nr:AraD1 family protein [Paracidobacterium acidisoli]MBT9331543.1 GguC protein [Paracidobacterium acidisoli]